MAKGSKKTQSGDGADLTDKEHHFCVEYSVTENATKSYQRAYGCGYNTAKSAGCLLLQNATVRQRIDELKRARNKRLEINADKVIKGIAALAFYDTRNFFDEDGRLKPISEIDPDEAAAIGGLETLHKVTGEENDGMAVITKVKLADRKGALELLAKHLQLLDNKQKEPDANWAEICRAMAETMARSETAGSNNAANDRPIPVQGGASRKAVGKD